MKSLGNRERSIKPDRRLRGTMLIEMLVYIAVLAVVIVLAARAFSRTLDHAREGRRVAADISRALAAGERWRADLRAANGLPRLEAAAPLQALHIPRPAGEVVYFFDGKSLTRGVGTNTPVSFLADLKASSFIRDQRQRVGSWRWEVELATRRPARVRPLFTFEAVAPAEARP